ncbi:MAG TPA: MFS transporter [Vicinamibacteria bacterium]|jgi:DHA1 family multidrug resistance protein-like MFS transporter
MRWVPEEPWVRNQYVMVATVFVVFTGFAFVLPFLPLYVRKLGVQGDEAVALWSGVLVGVSPLLAGLMAPLWGRLADRHGQKRMVVRALVSYVFLLTLSAAATRVEHLLVLRIGVGVFGGIGPLGLAMATSLAPRDQTGRAVGLVQAAQILAAAVGPLAGGFLADTIGIRSTFLVTAALCAAALWLVARYYREGRAAAPAAAGPGPAPALLRQRGVLALLVVLFLVNFVGRSFTPILPMHLQRLAVPAASLGLATGVLISAYSVAAAVSSTVLGNATRRFPPRVLLAASLAAGAATVLPMALISDFTSFLVLALLLGLASGGALTLCYTIGGLMVPSDHRATAFGFFSGAALFGGAISPTVAGLLAHWDLRGIYYLDTALFVLLTAGLLAAGLARTIVPSRAGEA